MLQRCWHHKEEWKKIEDLSDVEQLRFRKVLALRLIKEASLKKKQDTFIGFVDLAKAYDNVKWCKMFQILRKIGENYME